MGGRSPGNSFRSIIYLATAVAILYPLLSAVSPGWDTLLTYGIVLGIAALGFNLLLGYTGLLSFGHAAFFGVGAYTSALLLKFFDIRSIEIYLAAGGLAGAGLAFLIGPIVARYTRIYFAILMLAIAQVLWSLYLKFYWITGGSDGVRVGRPIVMGIDTSNLSYYDFQLLYHFYSLSIFVAMTYIMWRLVNSPFGYTLRAIRDNEERARFIGINVERFRIYALAISGFYTGVAGALYAPLNRLVTPELAYWTFSGEIIFITILGGFKSFIGPVVGSIIYTFLESIAVSYTEYWQLLLGVLIIVIMIFMPGGITDLIERIHTRLKKQEAKIHVEAG